MTRCIVHIGMHKTGSSSIQHSLYGFSDDQFLYAGLGKNPNHSLAVSCLFAEHPERHRLPRVLDIDGVSDYIAGIRADLERAIEAAQGRTLIISAEGISGFLRGDLVRMRDYFRKRFDEVSVVGYVRPPATYMTSAFQQGVKVRRTLNLQPDQIYRNYERTFNKFDKAFGRERVKLWKFDPKSLTEGCVVRDFCSRLGIALPAERIVRRNESLSRQAVCLLYTYRKLRKKYRSHTPAMRGGRRLASLLTGVGHDRFRLSPDIIRPVLEKNHADIEWMEARLGQSLREELGEHQSGDVRDQSDLLKPDPTAVRELRALLGDAAPAGVRGETPDEVALLVQAFREKHELPAEIQDGRNVSSPAPRAGLSKHGATPKQVTGVIEQLKQRNPKLLNGIPENRADALVRNVFKHISETLAGTEEGVVNYSGLGRFRVKRVEKDKGGAKFTCSRISFRMLEPGESKGSGRKQKRKVLATTPRPECG